MMLVEPTHKHRRAPHNDDDGENNSAVQNSPFIGREPNQGRGIPPSKQGLAGSSNAWKKRLVSDRIKKRYNTGSPPPATSSISSKSQRRRRVTFSPEAYVMRIPNLNDYSEEEIDAAWYNEDEYSRVQRSCRKIIHRMNTGETMTKSKHCPRGLEHLTDSAYEPHRRKMADAIRAVLDAQAAQDYPMDLVLSETYFKYSRQSGFEAAARAKKDEVEGYLGNALHIAQSMSRINHQRSSAHKKAVQSTTESTRRHDRRENKTMSGVQFCGVDDISAKGWFKRR